MRVQALYPIATVCVLVLSQTPAGSQPQSPMPVGKGQRLEAMAWPEAERVLTPETVVVLPVGAASKEHGPHLKLRNDLALADYLTGRVLDSSAVIVAPTLTYHYYPAFLEYPGSTSLTLSTSRDMTTEVVRTLSAYGPRRFYVLNTGVSTVRALQPAAALLAAEGVLMRYTNLSLHLDRAAKGFSEQEGGTHADEIETSMMLYIDPSSVDMSKAVKDYTPSTGYWPAQPAAGRDGYLFAHRHLGRSDARNARKRTDLCRSAGCGDPRRHRRSAIGRAADSIGRRRFRSGTHAPGCGAHARRSSIKPRRPLLAWRRTRDSRARSRVHDPLEQRRCPETWRDVVDGRQPRPPRRRHRAWRAVHRHQSRTALRSARIPVDATPTGPHDDPMPVDRHRGRRWQVGTTRCP